MKISVSKMMGTAIFLAIAVAWGLVVIRGKGAERAREAGEQLKMASPNLQLQATLLKEAKGPRKGAPGATVTIVEFSDLQCPSCKAAHPMLDRLLVDNPKARLIFEQYPLPEHPWALRAAAYAECLGAGNAEMFWTFVEDVYASQESIDASNSDKQFRLLIERHGAYSDSISKCVDSLEPQSRINDSIQLGKRIGVTGTPAIFIDGRRVFNFNITDYRQLNEFVRQEARSMSSAK
jgi:protein-disulfide isomerase